MACRRSATAWRWLSERFSAVSASPRVIDMTVRSSDMSISLTALMQRGLPYSLSIASSMSIGVSVLIVYKGKSFRVNICTKLRIMFSIF